MRCGGETPSCRCCRVGVSLGGVLVVVVVDIGIRISVVIAEGRIGTRCAVNFRQFTVEAFPNYQRVSCFRNPW